MSCFIAEKCNAALGTDVFVLMNEPQKMLPVGCHLNSTLVLFTLSHLVIYAANILQIWHNCKVQTGAD